MKLVTSEWGIANRFDDEIVINRHLFDNHKLLVPILQHELDHTSKTFSMEDVKLDVTPTGANRKELFKFMLQHPKTWVQLSPLYFRKGKLHYDINLTTAWVIIIIATWFWSSLLLNLIWSFI